MVQLRSKVFSFMIIQTNGRTITKTEEKEIIEFCNTIDKIIEHETPPDHYYTDRDICNLLNEISRELGLSLFFGCDGKDVVMTSRVIQRDINAFHHLTPIFNERYPGICFSEDWE